MTPKQLAQVEQWRLCGYTYKEIALAIGYHDGYCLKRRLVRAVGLCQLSPDCLNRELVKERREQNYSLPPLKVEWKIQQQQRVPDAQKLEQKSHELGGSRMLVRQRIDRGWSVEHAASVPVQKKGQNEQRDREIVRLWSEEEWSCAAISIKFNLSVERVRQIVRRKI